MTEEIISSIVAEIKGVLTANQADLHEFLKADISDFGNQMEAKGFASLGAKSDFYTMMRQFIGVLGYSNNVQDIEKHCLTFLDILTGLGGPFIKASDNLRVKLSSAVENKLPNIVFLRQPRRQPLSKTPTPANLEFLTNPQVSADLEDRLTAIEESLEDALSRIADIEMKLAAVITTDSENNQSTPGQVAAQGSGCIVEESNKKKPLLKDVYIALRGIAGDWNDLGRCLGVPLLRRKSIKHDVIDLDRLESILNSWLHEDFKYDDAREYPPTWPVLIKAVKEIGHEGVAAQIELLYGSLT